MASYRPGGVYSTGFTTLRIDTGMVTDADVLPTATAVRNGDYDVTLSLEVQRESLGHYTASGTIPAGWTRGDSVQVLAEALVNGIRGKQVIDSFELGGGRTEGLLWP
jgi:hypothetical protein